MSAPPFSPTMLVLCLIAAATGAIGSQITLADPLDYYRPSPSTGLEARSDGTHDGYRPPHSDHILRIKRDYNNDGRVDQAIGYESDCGNATCSFDLWLQTEEGKFRRIGVIGGLWWGYQLVYKRAGLGQLRSCERRAEQVFLAAEDITVEGIIENKQDSRYLSPDEECPVVPSEPFPCERCSHSDFLKSGTCVWRRCD